jgi:hypothetical protein
MTPVLWKDLKADVACAQGNMTCIADPEVDVSNDRAGPVGYREMIKWNQLRVALRFDNPLEQQHHRSGLKLCGGARKRGSRHVRGLRRRSTVRDLPAGILVIRVAPAGLLWCSDFPPCESEESHGERKPDDPRANIAVAERVHYTRDEEQRAGDVEECGFLHSRVSLPEGGLRRSRCETVGARCDSTPERPPKTCSARLSVGPR